MRQKKLSADELSIDPAKLGRIVKLVADGKIVRNAGKQVLSAVFNQDVDPDEYCKEKGLDAQSDTGEIEGAVKKVLDANEATVTKYKNGETKVRNALFGQVMKELKGTKTEANLLEAFAGESMARNKYTYYASKAKKDGYEQIAALFLKTAENEKEHDEYCNIEYCITDLTEIQKADDRYSKVHSIRIRLQGIDICIFSVHDILTSERQYLLAIMLD